MNNSIFLANGYTDHMVDDALLQLAHIDPSFIPCKGTKPFHLLILLMLNPFVDKPLAFGVLADDIRSPRQALTGPGHGYWNIANIGTKTGVYIIDSRHITGDPVDDRAARFDARLRHTDISYKQSQSESKRLAKARQQYYAARADQLDLGL